MKKVLLGILAVSSLLSTTQAFSNVNEDVKEKLLEIKKDTRALKFKIENLNYFLKSQERSVRHLNPYFFSPSIYEKIGQNISQIITNQSEGEIQKSLFNIDSAIGLTEIEIKTSTWTTIPVDQVCEKEYLKNKKALKRKVLEICVSQGRACEGQTSLIKYENNEQQADDSFFRKVKLKHCHSRAELFF